jgi:hypothetical protein
MAISLPGIIPFDFKGPTPIVPEGSFISPLSESAQFVGSATQLHEATFVSTPLTTDQMRIIRAVTDKASRDEIIIPVWEMFKLSSGLTNFPNFVTDNGILVTDALQPVWDGYLKSTITYTLVSASGFNVTVTTSRPSQLKAGQPISISTGGRWYLYTLAADSIAVTTHNLTLTSAIRAAHVNGNTVGIDQAFMQGKAMADWLPSLNEGSYRLTLNIRERM